MSRFTVATAEASTVNLVPGWVRYLGGRLPDETPDPNDDFFTDGSIGWASITPSGTATWTENRDVLSVVFDGQSSGDVCAQVKSVTGGVSVGDSIETAVSIFPQGAQNYYYYGLCFADGATETDNMIYGGFFVDNGHHLKHAVVGPGTFTNLPETYNQNLFSTGAHAAPLFLRFTYVSSNTWKKEVSPDGVTWSQLGASNSSGTLTPTHVGLVVGTKGAGNPGVGSFHYFRYNAA